MREEQRLRVIGTKVLWKIIWDKTNEITGEWRKLLNADLHALYYPHNIIMNLKSRRLRWAGHVARMEHSRNAYRILVRKPEGNRSLGRPRCRWEDNIEMDLKKVCCDAGDWLDFAQDGGGLCTEGNEPPGSISQIVELVTLLIIFLREVKCLFEIFKEFCNSFP